jgi:hypothetical protein
MGQGMVPARFAATMLGVPARALRRDTQPGVLASTAGMAKGAAR